MKRIIINLIVTYLIMWAGAQAQNVEQFQEPPGARFKEKAAGKNSPGFVDKNEDGINDRFVDADGDGRNDLNDKEYPHKFEFQDKNNDRINDLWVDRDGDGVNDLGAKFRGKEHQELHYNVLDADEDGRNDITGESYDKTVYRWKGERWGFWDERNGKLQGRFIDEDGDGIDDRLQDFDRFMSNRRQGQKHRDMFIDEDGDGICDWRTDFLDRMGKQGRKGRQGEKGAGHGPKR